MMVKLDKPKKEIIQRFESALVRMRDNRYTPEDVDELESTAWDVLPLLKAQEPRVMTLEEVEDALDTVVWVDRPLLDNSYDEYALIDAYSRKTQIVELRYPFCEKGYRERADYATYGKTWRCWTSRPTDEQRKAVKWDG